MFIITGAGSGIGKLLFNHFEKGDDTYGATHSTSIDDPRFSKLDVKNYAEVEKWKNSLPPEKIKKLVVINCAGVSYNAFTHKADVESWQNVINTNLIGTFNVIRAFLPHMRESNYGRIINIGSVVAQKGVPGTSAYAASKAALWGLAKAIAVENASKGITINNINLGYSDIGMGLTQISAPQKQDLLGKIPAGRFGSPQEIISTVDYLIGTEYVNGTSIDLNGAFI